MRHRTPCFLVSALALLGGPALAQTVDGLEFLGDQAVLTSAGRGEFPAPCPPGSDAKARCASHPFAWEDRPGPADYGPILQAQPADAVDIAVVCKVDDRQALADCHSYPLGGGDPAASTTAVQPLLPLFKLPSRAPDGAATAGMTVVLPIRWSRLRETLHPTAPRPSFAAPLFAPVPKAYAALAPVGDYFPERALRQGVGGTAVIQCHAAPGGALSACQAVWDYPREFGFRGSAVKMGNSGKVAAQPSAVPPGGGELWIKIPYPTPPSDFRIP